MKRFSFEKGDFYISEQCLEEKIREWDTIEGHFLERIDAMLYKLNPLFKEYIDSFIKKTKKPLAMLEAHGNTRKDKWKWYDGINGERERSVQQWIKNTEEKYSTLLICVCNPGNHKVYSKKSLLLTSDRTINFGASGEDMDETDAIFEVTHPIKGEINNYTIESELEELKNEINKSSL